MNCTCKCGGQISERNHEVKTERGIAEYGITCELPANIEISEFRSCGRNKLRIHNAQGITVLDRR